MGAVLLLALPHCAGTGRPDACAPDCEDDPDAGLTAQDAGVVPDPGADAGGGSGDAGPMAAPAEADFGRAACFDGADNDLAAGSDCADPSCSEAAYCCAGETHAGCCVGAGISVSLDFASCTASAPEDCGDASTLGAVSPALEGGALVPRGDATSDAGLVIGGALDPTRDRVVLSARIAGPPDGCAGDGCVDAVLLGLADPPADGAVRMMPDVAVMVRGSRGDVALLVAGEVVMSWNLETAEARRYTLELSPDGVATLKIDDVVQATASWLPRPDRRAVLFGRNHDITGGDPTRALSVTVTTNACDVPSALTRERGPLAPWPGTDWVGLSASAPSAAVTPGGVRYLAVEVPAGIALLREDAGTWTAVGDLREPTLLAPTGERYEDPELVVEAERLVLYLTHERSDGSRTIARAVGTPSFATTFSTPEDVAVPPVPSGGLESPSIVTFGVTDDGTPLRRMAATERIGGATRVVLLDASDADGTVFEWAEAPELARPGDALAFDAHEVGDPELFVDGHGLLRLYYAGRRGTRWSIGARVSGNAVEWRDAGAGPLLDGSGGGFDALGVRDPSVSIESGARAVYYTGMDGSRLSVGRATGRAP